MTTSNVKPNEVTNVRPGEHLDWMALERYLRDVFAIDGGRFEVWQFSNGAANLTYLIAMGSARFVIRRPPFGILAPGAHDMAREYRALAALSPRFDRAPTIYGFCDDVSIIGAVFSILEYREGVVILDRIPDSMIEHPDVARRVGFAVVDALAELHLLNVRDTSLKELGKPIGFLPRQLAGWTKRWDLVDTGRVPEMAVVGERLTAAMPLDFGRAVVLHNDYKIDNCQFDPSDPDRVSSIFDWDMASLGDPLVDLGTLLEYWPDPEDGDDHDLRHVPGRDLVGLPSRRELIERYARRTNFDVEPIQWYQALAAWRTAIIMEQLYQRSVSGDSDDPRMLDMAGPVSVLATRAARLIESSVGEG